ncbi:TRAP transporter small permease [Pontiella agarivorans]|uniref:TRAP transporter small permease n=1 Tax=Pontiella agarivorans TaxID=3038953 RepID=A0ABU5MYE2_9BACT|nr:TRAP transporter small permease [Pontiella agarivorans]MDZ8119190.1 TRAP transporter small permease [Pontiella agarivorans]
MPTALLKVKDGMTKVLNGALIIAVLLLVLDVVWGVFTRHILNEQAKWTEELARFLLVWVSMLGGAVAFGTKGHLGVDYFVGKFDPEVRKLMAVVSNLVVLFFAVSIFIIGGWQVVRDALVVEQTTPALGWKMGHVYLAVPIAGVFMVIYTLENLIEVILAKPEAE